MVCAAWIERKPDGHDCPLTHTALDRNVSPMLVVDLAHAGQTNSSPGGIVGCVTGAEEALEDVGQLRVRDTDAAVGDGDHRPGLLRAILGGDMHVDVASTRAVLDRIREQVVDEALEA